MGIYFLIKILLITINTSSKPPSGPQIHQEDIEELSKLLYVEAHQKEVKDMFLVGATVMNRVCDSKHPNTLKEVIHERRQYVGTKSPKWGNRTDVTDKVAYLLLKGHYVRGIKYFYNPKTSTDKRFLISMRKYPIKYKTKYHVFQ